MNIQNDSVTIDLTMPLTEAKDIIANSDWDVYIVRGDWQAIEDFLKHDGYTGFTRRIVKLAVTQLQADPYYSMLAARGFGK